MTIEVPTANLGITGHAPTVEIGMVEEHDEALPNTAQGGDEAAPVSGVARGGSILPSVRGGGQSLDPGDRIRLSDPSAVPVSKVERPHTASRQRLSQLLRTIDALHGYDAAGSRNTQEVPLSEDDLRNLRAVAAAAMALHEAPVISRSIFDALENIRQIIKKFGEVLVQATKTVAALAALATAATAAVVAIQALLVKVMPLFGA